jgi:alpha-2-macroglobulin
VDYELLVYEKNPSDEQDIGKNRMNYRYMLDPQKPLKKSTRYTVRLNSGIMTSRGNRPTDKPVISTFTTYNPFRFEETGFCSGCGDHLVTTPYLDFTNNPKYDDANNYLTIEPETEKRPFYEYGCRGNSIGIDDRLLEPNTTYTVTIKEGMIDEFGQVLENPQSVFITTGDLTPKMWGPSGYQIITPNIEPKLGIKTVNINTAFYKLLALRPGDILVRERLDYYHSIQNLLSKIKSEEKEIDISLNEFAVGKAYFDLKPYLRGENYGVVAYQFKSPHVACYDRPIEFNGLILRTNLGIYTQFYPTGGIIKLNQLTDGQPVARAKVRIYREDNLPRLAKIWDLISNTYISKIEPCFEGVTDENGVLNLSAEQSIQCSKRNVRNKDINELYPPEADPDDIMYDMERFGFAEPPRLLIVAEQGDDWTFLQTEQYGNPSMWHFGVVTAWEAERPISRGTMFTDHELYRPGDTVQVKGVSRYLLYGKLLTGEGRDYTIKVRDPMGAEKKIGTAKVSKFGTFNIEIPTREDDKLGYYQLIAETPNRGLRFYGNFRLAEFRVPEFAVDMNINKKIALPDEPIEISWDGKYYFGAPMSEASSSLNITRRRTYFRPEGWDGFSFGVPQYLEEQKVSLSGMYLKETIKLDRGGEALKTIRLRRDDVPYPMTYLSDAEVTDVSRQTISANKSITVLPGDQLVGINLSSWIATAKKPVNFSIIVSSPEGKALSGIPVRVKLIKKEYHSVRTKTADGQFTVEHNIEKKEVEQKEIISSEKPVEVSFIPEKAGSYLIWAELKRDPNSGTQAATSLWVAGEDYVPWADEGEDKLEIIMDKEEYAIGDEAVAFIKSPFPEAELFLTVSREKIFLQDTRKIQGSAYTYSFKVTEEMLPNAFVGAALFRLGNPIVPVEEEIGKHMERIGFAPIKVSLSKKYLSVKVHPDRLKARPAETVSVNIDVSRFNGIGHHSELTIMVVDEAVLSLTGYTPPDLVKVVYEQRGLSARINDNRPFVITAEELLQKGTGYGGGMMEGITGPRVRKKFMKLAYYDPSLVTDASGKAVFEMKLPDNLTTWRIMAVAVGDSNLFGYGEEKLVVTQPFILRTVLPRFARIGDEFFSGVAVTNLSESDGLVDVKADLTGQSVTLKEGKNQLSGIQIKTGESKAVLFPFLAKEVGETTMKFTAYFNGTFNGKTISEADALQMPLDVQDLVATETVVAVGETVDKYLQKIKIDDSVRKDVGGLDISLSSTALTDIGEGAKYLVQYPYGCLEQTTSRLLALMQLKYLSEKYGFTLDAVKDVDKVIKANIKKVLLMRNSDGGFKFWPTSDESDCYLSPYVAYLIKRGKDIGYSFSDDVVRGLIGYLDRTLRNPCYPIPGWKPLAEYRINVLMGLHYLGRKDETYFEEYFNKRNQLSFGAQIHLAYLLYQSPSWKKEAKILFDEIKNGMFVTAQTAHFESPRDLPPSWLFMYSPVITTADAIKLFLQMEPESPFISKFARYILNARKNGRWRYTYENSKAIDALVEISLEREAEPPDYTAKILIAGKEVLKHMFQDYQYKPVIKDIPIAQLPAGLNDIEIMKDGKGRLYYILSYSYRLKGAQTARQEGFSIKRSVKNTETGKILANYENEPPGELDIKAGDVLEIELEYSVPQTGYHVVIDDPIPAGLEAIDASLKTTSTRYGSPSQSRQTRGGDDDWWSWGNPINHTELRDDRVALFGDMVRPGKYTYRYMVRATTSGTYLWPAAKISLMYEPEQFGTCAEGFVSVGK